MKIKINIKGKIISGINISHYILIQDDTPSTGGYLIHLSKDPDFIDSHDDWVEDISSLKQYFKESNLVINWLDK
jgi:hypothetical protein